MACIECWIDMRDAYEENTYAESIVLGIQNCRVLVMIVSENAARFHDVSNEIALAFKQNKPIVPFIIRESDYALEQQHYLIRTAPIYAYSNFEKGLEILAEKITEAGS